MKKPSTKISDFKQSPLDIMKQLGDLVDEYKHHDDSEFWYDRNYFIKQNLDNDIDTYLSTGEEDKQLVLDYDLQTINILIQQILRFGRIVYSTKNGKVLNFPKNQIPKFWSYNVKHGGNLFSLLTEWKGPKILTSRKSKKIKNEDMQKILSSKEEILVVFGTTDKGIHAMLDKKINNVQNFKAWNFFPQQGTETVRLEEAILGSLSIINAFRFNK